MNKHKLSGAQEPGPSPYELVFKATNDVLYDLDVINDRVIWNDALYTQYGYHHSAVVNTLEWWVQHIHPDDALQVENNISDWLEGNADTWQTEYRFANADGTYKNVRDRGYVIRSADGKPLRIIGSLLDITQQKQLDVAKDEFISLVSHQLRTPLTVIRTYAEMLSQGIFGPISSQQKTEIERITGSSVRLIKLVSNILDVSKLELQRAAINPVPTDVNALISTYIGEIQSVASAKTATVQFIPQSDLPLINLDPTVFGQILHNYLTNAVRYCHIHNGEVTVAFTRNQEGYVLSVQDNGIGIPRTAQAHIFDRFYRAKNAQNTEHLGTGLGLYLVKLLAQVTGCRVWYESSRSQPTTFFLQIPQYGMTSNPVQSEANKPNTTT